MRPLANIAAAFLAAQFAAALPAAGFSTFEGSDSASFRSPFQAVDALGGTVASSGPGGLKLRQAGLQPVQALDRSTPVLSVNRQLWGGFLLRGNTPTFTATATPTHSPTSTATPTATRTGTPTATRTATRTATPSASPSATRTVTPTGTRTASPSPTPSITQTATPAPTAAGLANGTGLCGQYFEAPDLTQPEMIRQERPAFDWGTGVPDPSLSNKFSVQWTGEVEPPYTGFYVFRTYSDDGVRLYINGPLVLNHWFDQSATTRTASAVYLTAGVKVPIQLDFYENNEDAVIFLSWQHTLIPSQLVPLNRLYNSSCGGATPTSTSTISPTATRTATATGTWTPTASPSSTATGTATPSATPSATDTPTDSPTPTVSPTFTDVPGGSTLTDTPTISPSPSDSPTISPSPSDSPTGTPSATPTDSPSETPSATPTASPSDSPTASPSATETPSATPSETPEIEASQTATGTISVSPSVTPTASPSASPSETPSATPTESPSPSDTPTHTPSATPSGTPSHTPTDSPSPSASPSATPTLTASASASPTRSFTRSPTRSATIADTKTVTRTITRTRTAVPTATISPTITLTLSFSATRTVTLSFSPSDTVSPTRSVSATHSPTPSATPTAVPAVLALLAPSVSTWAGEFVDLTLQLNNSGGPAQGVFVSLTLPAGLSFAGPGPLRSYGYPVGDEWAEGSLSADGALLRGPLDVPNGSLALDLRLRVGSGTAPGLIVLPVQAASAAPQSISITVQAGAAPSRTATPTFSVSPTFTVSPTQTVTRSFTPYAGTPSSTTTPSPSHSATPQGPVLGLSLALASDPALYYAGQPVSFTVSFNNLSFAAQATGVRLYVMRDLATSNLATDVDPSFPVLAGGESNVAWYYVNDDDIATTQWKRGPYNNVFAGFDSGPIGLNFRLKDAAAGRTITTEVRLFIGGSYSGVSASASMLVPLYTPTPAVPATPTITPTPIVDMGRMAAYPQPAKDRVCFDYIAPPGSGSDLRLDVFNAAFQKVAQITDRAQDGVLQTTCVDLSAMAPGLYLVKARQGTHQYPAIKFAIVR